MATVFKMIMFFDAGGNGWTEDAYILARDDIPNLNDIKSTVTLRLGFLATNGQILGVRVTEVPAPYRSFLFGSTSGAGPGKLTSATNSVPWLGLSCRATSPSGVYSRQFTLRGIPQVFWNWTVTGPVNAVIPDLLKAPLNNYLAWLSGDQPEGVAKRTDTFVFRGRARNNASRTPTRISALTATNQNDQWVVTMLTDFPLAVGDTFSMTRVRGPGTSGANGPATVVTVLVPNRQYKVNRIKEDTAPVNYAITGYAVKLVPFFWPAQQCSPTEFVKRDEGRPIGGTRGRRRASPMFQ